MSENLIELIGTVVGFAVLYLIVRGTSRRAGVDNLLETAMKKMGRFRKALMQLKDLCTSAGATDTEKSAKALRRVLKSEKSVVRILNCYLYDDRSNMDIKDAMKVLNVIPEICREVLLSIAESGEPDVSKRFDQIEDNLKLALDLIGKADEIDKKNRLLKI